MKIHVLKTLIFRTIKIYLTYILFSAFLLMLFHNPNQGRLSAKANGMGEKYPDRVALVESGEEGAKVRLEIIASAKTSIDLAYYTITNGKIADTLFSSLLEAADRGVKIRILKDGLTRRLYERGPLREILRGCETHPNMEVRYYEKFNLLKPWSWNSRLHEKMIIADGKLALIGGRNIGDKYFLKDEYRQGFVNDRDVLIYRDRLQPSVIPGMQAYFDQLWEYKHTKPHKRALAAKQAQRGETSNERLRNLYREVAGRHPELFMMPDWKQRTYATEGVQFVHNPLGRGNKEPWCLEALLALASKATSSIFVQSPYIIPTRRMRTLIGEYGIGLDTISVLTNSKRSSPNPIAIAAYFNHRDAIVDTTCEVYEYQGPDSIHSKSYIIDDCISIIGTYNLDARSSYINTESMVIIYSNEFASDLAREIQASMDNSVLVRKDHTYGGEAEDKRPAWLLSKVVGLFEHLL